MFDNSSCHFKCTEDDAELYAKGVKEFLATKQDRPKCCAITSTRYINGVACPPEVIGRNYAKMKMVTDKEKENFGRPFFVCPHKRDSCNYFEWGDQKIPETPLCEHLRACRMFTVKKGPNKNRRFFCCGERGENRCKFFQWFEELED